jgi:hypothetical protein
MEKKKSDTEVLRKYYGLSWPTLIVGAVVILAIAGGYLWLVSIAVTSP